MKRVLAPACLAAVFAVGLSAQVPSSQAPSSTTTTQTEKQAGSVTLTGCVRAGEQPDSFVLADVKLDKDKAAATTSSTTVGTTGTAGAPSASATATSTTTAPADLENSTVKLSGSPAGATLSDHVGHMVQITGTLSPESASTTSTTTTGTTGTTTSTTTPAPAAGAKAGRTLNVTSLTMVSATCEK